ncbi:lipoprotein [Streptomyces aureoverticillatus]|nr:lipoprotein [Streptomyces aureoverticillatus]
MTGRRLKAALATAALTATLAGCGIRSTEVPTDFGAAPSRVPCVASDSGISPQDEAAGVPVQIFLVCSSQLVAVDRTVRIPTEKASTDRVRIAQALLAELSTPPSQAAKQAGYATDVRRGMTVTGPRRGDPDEALRLNRPPRDLSAYALAQIVCTYADSAASDGGSVVLGGPNGSPLRRYECTPDVRARPGTVEPPSRAVGG